MKKERYEEQLCGGLLTAEDIVERLINNQTQTPGEACVACSYALAKLTSSWDTRLDIKILSGWWERFKFVHPSNSKDGCLLLKPKLAIIAASHRNQMGEYTFSLLIVIAQKRPQTSIKSTVRIGRKDSAQDRQQSLPQPGRHNQIVTALAHPRAKGEKINVE